MREITSHIVEGDTGPQLKIEALGEPNPGGDYPSYLVSYNHDLVWTLSFQNGPIGERGINGLSNEALLAIVQHRLECFQAGPFAAQENATALSNINNAIRALQQRTLKRIARGVEGKSVA